MKRAGWITLAALWAAIPVFSGVPCGECFPVEQAPEQVRRRAEELLLKALDSEALYTIAGGLKPVSGGLARFEFVLDGAKLDDLEQTRRSLEFFRCGGELFATVHHFAKVWEGNRRYADVVIIHLPSFRSMLAARRDFFAPYGITPSASPMEALMAVEYDRTGARFRGQGYFFGYPDYAIDFFVKAAAESDAGGALVPRDFYSIPTFSRPTHGFVWAVPKGHQEAPEDVFLRQRAAAILEDYHQRRAKFIGEGKPGVVALLRDWMGDGRGQCAVPTLPGAGAPPR